MKTLLLAVTLAVAVSAQSRTILAIGAHAGDMELTAGAVMLHQKKAGDRIVFLHLSAGEGGNPKMSPAKYLEQKRAEAQAAAKAFGAEVRFGPYRDGQVPDNDEARRWVADAIREIKPTTVITHWSSSIHKDHAITSRVAEDAVLLASLEDVKTDHPAWRGIQRVLFAENWEDPKGFQPYLYVDVTDAYDEWKAAVRQYEFIRGGISSFHYTDYYEALLKLRGAEVRFGAAQAFDVDSLGKRKVLPSL